MSKNIPGIVTGCFKSLLQCFKILAKRRVTPKVLIIYQKHLFTLMPKSFSKIKRFEKFENAKNCPNIMLFCFCNRRQYPKRALVLNH